ncbi:MAG TPA: DUF1848 family protein [bacterium]|nr:DUF1848 family protein [bacterium]HOL47354.1 DUF1848 family protein [bacterium]HPQ18913.1 DUF1848 family protein [bacterium]
MEKYIISVSRRTDIPYFYKDWFLEKIKNGKCIVPNPFNKKSSYEVDLSKDSVHSFVFWSKNFTKFIDIIKMLKEEKFGIFIHYTINDYSSPFERINEELKNLIENFKEISTLINKKSIVWRYDPIVLSKITDINYHKNKFEEISNLLKNYVENVYISFVCFYKKVVKKFSEYPELKIYEPSIEIKKEIIKKISEIAEKNEQKIFSCCNPELFNMEKVNSGSCINALQIAENYNDFNLVIKKQPTRKYCGCYYSKDIGTYGSCKFNCLYCYAN